MNKKGLILFIASAFVVAAASGLKYQTKSSSRSLASVSLDLPFANKDFYPEKIKIKDEISFDCKSFDDENKTVGLNSQVVMLKFKKCDTDQNKKIVGYRIINHSNGYEGQIFKEKLSNLSSNLTTDYIQLDAGNNLIELEISLIDGQKINKKIKINR